MKYLKNIIWQVHSLGNAFAFGLMITTAYMAYTLAQSLIAGNFTLPSNLETMLVVGAAIIATYVIDDHLYKHGVSGIGGLIDRQEMKGPAAWLAIIGIFLLFGMRLVFSGGSTWMTGQLVAVETTVAPDTEKVLSISREKNAAMAAARKEQAATAERALAAERERAAMVIENALNSGNTAQRKLYEKKDSWMLSQSAGDANVAYVRRVRRAEKEAAGILAAANAEYNKRIAAMETHIAAIGADEAYTAAATAATAELKRAELITRIKTGWVSLIDIVLIMGFVFCSIVTALYIRETNTPLEVFFPDEPGIGQVIADGLKSGYSYFVAGIASVVAELKGKGSVKMKRVATSITTSSRQWQAATGAYTEAMRYRLTQEDARPTSAPPAAPPPQGNRPTAPAFIGGHPDDSFAKATSEAYGRVKSGNYSGVPPEHTPYTPPTPTPQSRAESAPPPRPAPLSPTAPPRPTSERPTPAAPPEESAPPEGSTDAGAAYRRELSKARGYIETGSIDAAKRRLQRAIEKAVNEQQRKAAKELLKQLENE